MYFLHQLLLRLEDRKGKISAGNTQVNTGNSNLKYITIFIEAMSCNVCTDGRIIIIMPPPSMHSIMRAKMFGVIASKSWIINILKVCPKTDAVSLNKQKT